MRESRLMKSPLASISSWVGSRSVYFLSSQHQCRPISFNYLCSSSLQPCFWHNLTARACVVVHYCVHDDCALIAWFKLIIMIEMIVAPSKEIGLLHWNKLTSTSDHDCFMAVKMLRSQVGMLMIVITFDTADDVYSDDIDVGSGVDDQQITWNSGQPDPLNTVGTRNPRMNSWLPWLPTYNIQNYRTSIVMVLSTTINMITITITISTSSLSKATKMIEYLSLHFDLTRARATSIIAATPMDAKGDIFDIDCHVLPDPLSLYPSVNPVVSQWAPITRILSSLEVNMTWASVLVDCWPGSIVGSRVDSNYVASLTDIGSIVPKLWKSLSPHLNGYCLTNPKYWVGHHDDVMTKTYKSMKLSWVEWLGARQQPKSSKLAHDVLTCNIHNDHHYGVMPWSSMFMTGSLEVLRAPTSS